MFGEPLQGVKGSVRPRRAVLQEAIEVQCIRWEQAVLLLHVGPQLSPGLQGIHHRRSFGLCDLPLRQSIQSVLPLSVPLRGQLPLRTHDLGLRKGLPQCRSSQQHSLWLVWTWPDSKSLDHLALLHHGRLGRRPCRWPISGARALSHGSRLRDEVSFGSLGARLQPRICHMVSSMCHCAVIGCKRICEVSLIM